MKTLLVWILFCSLTLHIKAQSGFEYYQSLFERDGVSMVQIKQKVDSIILSNHSNDAQFESIKIVHHFSRKYYRKKLYKDAQVYGNKEIAIYEKLGIQNDRYVQALYGLAIFYSKDKKYEASFNLHKKVITLNKEPYSTAKSYCEIGQYYWLIGDFFKSKNYYAQGIYLLEKLDNKKLLIKKYLDFTHVLGEIATENSLDKKLEILNKANKLFQEVNPKTQLRDYYSMNNSYANYYNTEERFDFYQAKIYYEKNLKEANLVKDTAVLYASYTNLGELYINSVRDLQKDSTLYFLKNGLKYVQEQKEEAPIYYQLSKFYYKKKSYVLALEHIQKALMASFALDQDLKTEPNLSNLTIADDTYDVLLTFIQKATVLIKLHLQKPNIEYLKNALSTLISADRLVDILIENSSEKGSQLHWRKEAEQIYTKGILICAILKEKEKAFYFSEKKKALLLTIDILKNAKKVKLPKVVVKQQNLFKKNILDLENRISHLKSSDSIAYLKNLHFNLKQAYQKYEDSLALEFSEIYTNKEIKRVIPLKKVQQELDPETIVISYVSAKDSDDPAFDYTYAIIVSSTHIEIVKIATVKDIEKWVINYRKMISKPFETTDQRQCFEEVSHTLYQALVPENKFKKAITNKHIVIIPDGHLQYIPFESLIVDKKEKRYFIEKNEISYAYSLSFSHHNNGLKRQASNDVIAFAPISFAHDNLSNLHKSEDEINGILDHISGDTHINEQATKRNFLTNQKDYKILHLATHANFGNNLQIAFHDSNLAYHELYTFQNQAELVVMSACNTSLGEIATGEGVMSLARGFFYSGANTVVSTFWNANDKSTAIIMKDFYYNLSIGQTKSKALHNAKIRYLKKASLSDASPYYWSPLVLVGDAETILFPSNNFFNWSVFLIFLLLTISVLLLFMKKR